MHQYRRGARSLAWLAGPALFILAAAAHAQQAPLQWPPAPPGGAMPRSGPPTTYLPSPQTGTFADAFGRFRAALPAGAEQVNATYAFAVPASGLQINISVATRDAMFQNSLQSFPEMMRQSGAQNVGQQQFDQRGRQATMIIAQMRNPQGGGAFQSLNVFIPGPNLWLQVNSPEQSNQQGEEAMRALLTTLQYP
jgi:hypothetical protein